MSVAELEQLIIEIKLETYWGDNLNPLEKGW